MPTTTILRVDFDPTRGLGLFPVGAEGEEALERFTRGSEVKAEITQQGRNIKRLRLFFALMNEIHPHQDIYPTVDKLRKAVLCAIGFCETIKLPDGREILAADSISFARMEEPDFIDVLERSIAFIYQRIIPGVASDELMKRINEICEGRPK